MHNKINSSHDENSTLKAAAVAILALIAVLLGLSVLFYKERMLFIDAPHILFSIINDGVLQITEHRYGSFITQIVPLLGAKLHLPLRVLMVMYSASFFLFFLTVAFLLVYKFRNYGLAILFGLYLTLFAGDTFYWPNNEVHQGIGWLFLALAVSFYMARKKMPFLPSLLLFVCSFYLAIWTHPLVMLVAVYLWFFYWLDKKAWPYSKVQSYIYTGILLALSYWKFYQGQHHGYDSCKIEVVTQFNPGQFKTIFSSPQFRFFVKGCFTNYWLFVTVFITGLFGLMKEKKYLLLIYTLLFAAGYCMLLFITFRDINTNRFYLESEYMPLSIICSAPFVYYVLPKLNWKVSVALIVLTCFIRLAYICSAVTPFTGRLALMEKISAKMKEKNLTKVIITNSEKDVNDILIMNWGAPVESIIMSQLKGEMPQRTFIFLNADEIKAMPVSSNDTLIGCWKLWPKNKINNHYFRMDTCAQYQVVDYGKLME